MLFRMRKRNFPTSVADGERTDEDVMATASARRREERVPTALPVRLSEGTTGVTRDVSASGVFFETDKECVAGSEISFAIEVDGPTGKMMLKCQGRVVRVEQRDGKIGVAAKIVESRLEPVDPAQRIT